MHDSELDSLIRQALRPKPLPDTQKQAAWERLQRQALMQTPLPPAGLRHRFGRVFHTLRQALTAALASDIRYDCLEQMRSGSLPRGQLSLTFATSFVHSPRLTIG
jgi:hypothetical protein